MGKEAPAGASALTQLSIATFFRGGPPKSAAAAQGGGKNNKKRDAPRAEAPASKPAKQAKQAKKHAAAGTSAGSDASRGGAAGQEQGAGGCSVGAEAQQLGSSAAKGKGKKGKEGKASKPKADASKPEPKPPTSPSPGRDRGDEAMAGAAERPAWGGLGEASADEGPRWSSKGAAEPAVMKAYIPLAVDEEVEGDAPGGQSEKMLGGRQGWAQAGASSEAEEDAPPEPDASGETSGSDGGGDGEGSSAAAKEHSSSGGGGAGAGQGGAGDENEYERLRDERIARNKAMMAQLGIQGGLDIPAPAKKPPPPKKKAARKPASKAEELPRRDRMTAAAIAASAAEEAEEEEQPLVYDDSSVKRYVCSDLAGPAASPAGPVPASASLAGFAPLPGGFYGTERRPQTRLGEDEGEEYAEPLLQCQLCRTWIADVKFLPQSREDATLLLSASNNGTVVLWDINKCVQDRGRAQAPKRLADLEAHASGIFQMHELGGRILTASKDASVGLSRITPAGELVLEGSFSGMHAGVIKSARWRPCGNVFASGGNDGRVCVSDSRLNEDAACTLSIEGVHDAAVCCVEWHPQDEHLLLSSGNDTRIYLHDMRSPKDPLYTFTGHHAPGIRTCKQITRPVFAGAGRGIVTTGERSPHLSLYCARTGATISRGEVDVNATTVFGGDGGERSPLVLGSTSGLLQFRPVWEL